MSITFEASNSKYIDCASSASVDDVVIKTITGWIRLDDESANQNVLTKGKAGTNTGWQFLCTDQSGTGDYKLRLTEGWATSFAGWETDNNFSYNVRYHVAMVYDSGSSANNPIFYANGTLEANTETNAPAGAHGSDAAATLLVGAHADLAAGFYDGAMEDIRMFNRALSTNEIGLLTAGYRGPIGNEVLWLDMEGVSNVTLSSAYASVLDKTPNKNNGTPQGALVSNLSKMPRYG